MSKFYVVSSDILPDVLEKVIEARSLLELGKVKKISEAVKLVGISRGTYYKYKDAVFAFNEDQSHRRAVISMLISSRHGTLSQILSVIANSLSNILAINQTIPINGTHTISLTLDISEMQMGIDVLLSQLDELDVVEKVDLVAVE